LIGKVEFFTGGLLPYFPVGGVIPLQHVPVAEPPPPSHVAADCYNHRYYSRIIQGGTKTPDCFSELITLCFHVPEFNEPETWPPNPVVRVVDVFMFQYCNIE